MAQTGVFTNNPQASAIHLLQDQTGGNVHRCIYCETVLLNWINMGTLEAHFLASPQCQSARERVELAVTEAQARAIRSPNPTPTAQLRGLQSPNMQLSGGHSGGVNFGSATIHNSTININFNAPVQPNVAAARTTAVSAPAFGFGFAGH